MRAFLINEFGKPGTVAEVPDPRPGADEVLVRVRAASVNPMDAFVISGGVAQYAEVKMPLVPGLDAVGIVESVGPGSNGFQPGDEVVVSAATKPSWGEGTFAEFVAVPKNAVAHKPAEVEDAAAASVPQAGLTALSAIDALQLRPTETIAVVGATGGVGSWFVQLAKHGGAQVIAFARPENADYARSLGADAVIDYTKNDWAEQVRTAADSGLDAVADFSGNAQMVEELSSAIRPGGRLASSIVQLDREAYAARGLSAAQANRSDPARMSELLTLLAAGKVQSPAAQVLPLEKAGQAIDEIGRGHTTGKIVLKIG